MALNDDNNRKKMMKSFFCLFVPYDTHAVILEIALYKQMEKETI